MIASVSGIRGVFNDDVSLSDFARFATNFAGTVGGGEVLVARDTRSTGPAIARAVASAVTARGMDVVDYGMASTPALFRESLVRRKPAIMITASHNEPQFNGLKFVVEGAGAGAELVEEALAERNRTTGKGFGAGVLRRRPKASYNDDLVERFGEGSCKGVRVALDLGGGSAIFHAVPILRRLGCEVLPINDSWGIFNRKIDPMADELQALRALVKARECDVGFGFDCDGDRLCVVDGRGAKRSGDFMLSLAVSRILKESGGRVVVSQDTTAVIDEMAAKLGGEVFRSKVGEVNVVGMMREKKVGVGGEGSSGGLIDGTFNLCRDSMLAALLIVGALKQEGQKLYSSVRSYAQERAALSVSRRKARGVIKALAESNKGADTTDGVKIWLTRRSWVLVRPSNTEDVVRVSAEAETRSAAKRIVAEYSGRIVELSR